MNKTREGRKKIGKAKSKQDFPGPEKKENNGTRGRAGGSLANLGKKRGCRVQKEEKSTKKTWSKTLVNKKNTKPILFDSIK